MPNTPPAQETGNSQARLAFLPNLQRPYWAGWARVTHSPNLIHMENEVSSSNKIWAHPRTPEQASQEQTQSLQIYTQCLIQILRPNKLKKFRVLFPQGKCKTAPGELAAKMLQGKQNSLSSQILWRHKNDRSGHPGWPRALQQWSLQCTTQNFPPVGICITLKACWVKICPCIRCPSRLRLNAQPQTVNGFNKLLEGPVLPSGQNIHGIRCVFSKSSRVPWQPHEHHLRLAALLHDTHPLLCTVCSRSNWIKLPRM